MTKPEEGRGPTSSKKRGNERQRSQTGPRDRIATHAANTAGIHCRPLHHPKASALIVNKLPKLVCCLRSILRIRELRCYGSDKISFWLSRNHPIDIHRQVCPYRQKPPTDVCRDRVCIG